MNYSFNIENERLPYKLGWKKPKDPITEDDLFAMIGRVNDAAAVPPGYGYIPPTTAAGKREITWRTIH